MPKPENPGAQLGSQIISLSEPFAGWVSPLSSVNAATSYVASVEGVEAAINQNQKNQIAISDGVTLFHPERFGHMSPGQGYSVLTDSEVLINDLPLNGGVESTHGYGITLLKNGRLVQIDLSTNSTVASKDPTTHTPISTGDVDMIIFRDYYSTITEWVIWTWESSNAVDIAIVKATDISTSFDDDFGSNELSLTLTPLVPHKLVTGPDGNIYVLDGARVIQIVVASGSALTSATVGNILPLGSGWIATDIIRYKNYVKIIASNKLANASRGETKVFLWDGTTSTVNGVTSTAPQFIFDLPDNVGQGLFFDGNVSYAFTSGRNFSSKMFEFTGTGYKKVVETPFIVPGTGSLKGSIESFQDGIMIGALKSGTNGHLFRFYGGGLHDEGYLCDADTGTGHIASAVGMVKNLYQNYLFVGVQYSSTYKIFITNPNTYQTSTGSGPTIDLRTILYTSGVLGRRMYPMGYKMNVIRFKLFFSQWGTGASLYLSLFKDYSAFAAGGPNDLLSLLIDTNTAIAEGEITGTTNPGGYANTPYIHHVNSSGSMEIDISDISIEDISSFYMNIRWLHPATNSVAAIIRRIEIHVEGSQ